LSCSVQDSGTRCYFNFDVVNSYFYHRTKLQAVLGLNHNFLFVPLVETSHAIQIHL
jgi:hypothetical protein